MRRRELEELGIRPTFLRRLRSFLSLWLDPWFLASVTMAAGLHVMVILLARSIPPDQRALNPAMFEMPDRFARLKLLPARGLITFQAPRAVLGDTASYRSVRRYLRRGTLPPPDAVRIDELVNAFSYDYGRPKGPHPFSVRVDLTRCPWNRRHQLVRIGLKGRERSGGTPEAIARDAKLKVEFNPAAVVSFRLLDRENRLRVVWDPDVDDERDVGEIGAGHTATALYEIAPRPRAWHRELLTVKLRYRRPSSARRRTIVLRVAARQMEIAAASPDLQFAAAVAWFGLLLRDPPKTDADHMEQALALARRGIGHDPNGRRGEFLELLGAARKLMR